MSSAEIRTIQFSSDSIPALDARGAAGRQAVSRWCKVAGLVIIGGAIAYSGISNAPGVLGASLFVGLCGAGVFAVGRLLDWR